MTTRLKTSAALTAAIVLVAGCWEEDTTVADGMAETPIEQGALSENVARTTDELAIIQGEEAVEELEEQAEIDSETAAARNAQNDLGLVDLGSAADPAADASGPAAVVERMSSDTGGASQDATDSAHQAAREGESPAEAAKDDARIAADVMGTVGAETDTDAERAAALTAEDFDMDAARAAIEASDLDQVQQQVLIGGIEAAQDEPLILASVLRQARLELGLE